MIVGLISDVHGNVHGLRAVLAALRPNALQKIICAGDVVGYYPFVNETIELLRTENIDCIMGNHDALLTEHLPASDRQRRRYALDYAASVISPENLAWLHQLPSHLHLKIDNIAIHVYHGSPWAPLTEYIYPDHESFERFCSIEADVVVLGHTHWPLLRIVGGVTIVNPGSCGQPRHHRPGASYALLDTESRDVALRHVTYPLEPVVEAVRAQNLGEELVDILYRTQ